MYRNQHNSTLAPPSISESIKSQFVIEIAKLKSIITESNDKIVDLEQQNSELYENMVILQDQVRSFKESELESIPNITNKDKVAPK